MKHLNYVPLMEAAEKAVSRKEALRLIHAATAIRQEEATLRRPHHGRWK